MGIEVSRTQQQRAEKIERLRQYFKVEKREIYVWKTSDEQQDFKSMSDFEVAAYLKESD